MTRRMIAVVLATTVLALLLAAAAPRAEAVSFVDKQVQAGALLIQKYINDYGQDNRFVYPPKSMVKKGGGLPGLDDHLAVQPLDRQGSWRPVPREAPTRTRPSAERRQLQVRRPPLERQLDAVGWRARLVQAGAQHRGEAEPAAAAAVPRRLQGRPRRLPGDRVAHPGDLPSPTYVWPRNPWTGAAMAASDTLGDFSYARRQRDRLHAQGQADQRMERGLRPGLAAQQAHGDAGRLTSCGPATAPATLHARFDPCSGHDLIDPDPRLTEAGIIVAGPIVVGGKPCTAVSFRPSCSRSPAHS